jgi:acyl-CoA dehydrogenase
VETFHDGFRRGQLLEKVGHKAQDTTELFLDEVRVPADALLGEAGKGLGSLMQELPAERLLIAISALALAEAVFTQTVDYVHQRRAFGKAIAEFQATRFTLAELKTEIEVGKALVDNCVDEVLNGTLGTSRASMAKLWLTEMQGRVIDRCVQLFGGYGYMWEYPVARAFANARGQRIYGGSNDIMKEIIAREIFAK